MGKTKIDWTDRTWNPVTGCSEKSTGCKNCYAKRLALKAQAEGKLKYKYGFTVTLHEDCLDEPLSWKKTSNIFVCSMADIFHEKVPFEFIDRILRVIKQTPYHTYQILTKRAERMYEYFSNRNIPVNVWLGVTVEASALRDRIYYLRNLSATVKFISCEPLVDDLGELYLEGIDWVIVGGETGFGARPMREEWVLNIKNQVQRSGIPFFFKQWGVWGPDGVRRSKEENGKLLQGQLIQEMPAVEPNIPKMEPLF